MRHPVASLRRFFPALTLAAMLGGRLQPASAQADGSIDRLDPTTRLAVQTVIDSAVALGLPAHPLVSKALEGSAKHAAPTRIVAAVQAIAADLAVARDALGRKAGEETLIAGAGALRAGVTPAYLRQLREARRRPDVAWPLTILADLVSRGVPVDTAAGVVLDLARSGATDASYSALQEQVRQDVSAGVPPGSAATVRAAARPPTVGPPVRPAHPPIPRP
jgi:hypothetical protein